ncbi:MAG TPA: hypothetical protein VF772_05055 [Terriglobales bacterium]
MARFNEILVGRFARALQKLTGIKGAVPTPQLSTEIFPSFQLFWGVENRVLEGWQRYATFASITSGAGQVGGWRLRNPTNSNVMGIIEKVQVTNRSTTAIIAQLNQQYLGGIADLTGIIVCSGLDNRLNPTSVNNNLISSFSNTGVIAGGANVGEMGIPIGGTVDFVLFEDHEITLMQNGMCQILTATANQQFDVVCIWRERFVEDSERSA